MAGTGVGGVGVGVAGIGVSVGGIDVAVGIGGTGVDVGAAGIGVGDVDGRSSGVGVGWADTTVAVGSVIGSASPGSTVDGPPHAVATTKVKTSDATRGRHIGLGIEIFTMSLTSGELGLVPNIEEYSQISLRAADGSTQ